MPDLNEILPKSLAAKSRRTLFAGVPTLLCHPDWESPAPLCFWMHGRTANKELDPGRYSRWLRAGVAAVAIDLPGHGQRVHDLGEQDLSGPESTLEVIRRARGDVDAVLGSVDNEFGSLFDIDHSAIGGMSLGGMVALRRLCDPHGFKAAAVEATTGDLLALYDPQSHGINAPAWPVAHDDDQAREQSTSEHLPGFEPLPLLALHTEADRMVPWQGQRAFLDRLRAHYTERREDPALIELKTWDQTGAPEEHIGFGSASHEAKTTQAEFLARALAPSL